jgi:hypothetical protein
MSCEECDKFQESGNIYYLRMGIANIGIIACEKHFNEARYKILKRGGQNRTC